MKVVLVTNIPAPYRIPVFNRIAKELHEKFLVLYCARFEPNRQWDLPDFEFKHTYLKESCISSHGSYIHNNPDVINILRRFHPDVVITTGFNPTHLYAWLFALATGSGHIPMTDGWITSESDLSIAHRLLRKLVFKTSRSFIGAGKKSIDLYRSYGYSDNIIYQSHLCVDNSKFILLSSNCNRSYDLMYSGNIVDSKNPKLFINVVRLLICLRGKVSVLVIGDGMLRDEFLKSLREEGAEVTYAGFVAQRDLPIYYSQAKLLLFTTSKDAWGIVVNEALASGTPVITTPYAGVAHDLVVDGKNGYVINSDASLWAKRIMELLTNETVLNEMRFNAVASVAEYNFDNAAIGIIEAAKKAYNRSGWRMK